MQIAIVSDGMDMTGLPGIGLVDHAIHPDWIDEKIFSRHIRRIVVTARYVLTQRMNRPKPGEMFHEWEGNFYNTYPQLVFTKLINPGAVIVLDDVEDKDVRTNLYIKLGLPFDRTVK